MEYIANRRSAGRVLAGAGFETKAGRIFLLMDPMASGFSGKMTG